MMEKKFIGTFHSQEQVLNKIEELKQLGYLENHIYVITNDKNSLSMVRGQTDVDLRSSDGGWLNRFLAFVSGDEPVKSEFIHMGFSKEESLHYYQELKREKILLYVDEEYENRSKRGLVEVQRGYTDPNIGGNLTVQPVESTNVEMNVTDMHMPPENNTDLLNEVRALNSEVIETLTPLYEETQHEPPKNENVIAKTSFFPPTDSSKY